MSQENVEIVRALFEAWNAGDMNAVRAQFHPEVITRAVEGWPEPGPFIGGEANMRELERLREAWDTDTVEPISDFIDVGDRVAVRLAWRGLGHGPDANLEMTWLVTLRKGKIHYGEFLWDHAEALEAVGLSE